MSAPKLRNGVMALAIALGIAVPAQASYTVQTAVDSVSPPAGATVLALPNSGTFAIDAGSVSYGHGGSEILLASGVDVYLINTFSTLNAGPIPGYPSEQIYVSAPAGATDSSTISFSIGYGINGGLDSFVEAGSVAMEIAGGAGSYFVQSQLGNQPNYTSGGMMYTATSTSGNGDINSLSNGFVGLSLMAAPSVVPEPASIALLGLGLAAVAGVSIRRRRPA